MRHAVNTDSVDEIAEALRDRINYKTTQNDLAKQLGISHSHLSEVLSGKKKVGPVILEKLGYDPMPRYAKRNGKVKS